MEKQNKKLAQVLHFDLYGKREEKYDFLTENSLKSIDWNELDPDEPYYFLVNKNFKGSEEYGKGFGINELFIVYGMGITTSNDKELIGFNENELTQRFPNECRLKKVNYRLFDIRYINYDTKLVERAREKLMVNFIDVDNFGLVSLKGIRNDLLSKFCITKLIIDKSYVSTLDNGYVFPLYLYPETNVQQTIDQSHTSTSSVQGRTPNLNPEILKEIAKNLGLGFVPEKEPEGNVCYINNPEVRDDYKTTFAPIDLLDYIYAVLHSPTYREKYKEFLKIDFPRVPYPKDSDTFWQLVKLGGEIRQIHLLESPAVENFITQYPIDGDNVVGKTRYQDGKVYINETQYFDNVPPIAWEFYIGGYQPAKKWLKDRKNRKLEFEDVQHYQKIIVALSETDRLMKAIDLIDIG